MATAPASPSNSITPSHATTARTLTPGGSAASASATGGSAADIDAEASSASTTCAGAGSVYASTRCTIVPTDLSYGSSKATVSTPASRGTSTKTPPDNAGSLTRARS